MRFLESKGGAFSETEQPERLVGESLVSLGLNIQSLEMSRTPNNVDLGQGKIGTRYTLTDGAKTLTVEYGRDCVRLMVPEKIRQAGLEKPFRVVAEYLKQHLRKEISNVSFESLIAKAITHVEETAIASSLFGFIDALDGDLPMAIRALRTEAS